MPYMHFLVLLGRAGAPSNTKVMAFPSPVPSDNSPWDTNWLYRLLLCQLQERVVGLHWEYPGCTEEQEKTETHWDSTQSDMSPSKAWERCEIWLWHQVH